MTEFDDKRHRKKSEIQEEYERHEKHGRGPCLTCNQPFNPSLKLSAEELSIVHANIEAVHNIGDPHAREKIPYQVPVAAFSENEYEVAKEAIASMSDKYGFRAYDYRALHNAILIIIYYSMMRGHSDREQLAISLSKIKWQ